MWQFSSGCGRPHKCSHKLERQIANKRLCRPVALQHFQLQGSFVPHCKALISSCQIKNFCFCFWFKTLFSELAKLNSKMDMIMKTLVLMDKRLTLVEDQLKKQEESGQMKWKFRVIQMKIKYFFNFHYSQIDYEWK